MGALTLFRGWWGTKIEVRGRRWRIMVVAVKRTNRAKTVGWHMNTERRLDFGAYDWTIWRVEFWLCLRQSMLIGHPQSELIPRCFTRFIRVRFHTKVKISSHEIIHFKGLKIFIHIWPSADARHMWGPGSRLSGLTRYCTRIHTTIFSSSKIYFINFPDLFGHITDNIPNVPFSCRDKWIIWNKWASYASTSLRIRSRIVKSKRDQCAPPNCETPSWFDWSSDQPAACHFSDTTGDVGLPH